MTMHRPSLEALTASGARDLAGAIGAPPPTVAPATRPAPDEPAPAAAAEKPARTTDEVVRQDTRKQAVPIYLPAALLARRRAATTKTGESYSDWGLDAYEIVHDRLGERFAPIATRTSGLPPRRRATRRHVENPVAVQLRFTGAELQVLEQKREAVGSPPKSAFYIAIIEMRLELEEAAERAAALGGGDRGDDDG